jgi:hypothetical protein
MSKEKSPKRFCEECGRIIDSRRLGVTLCRQCEEEILGELRSRDKKRQKDRSRAREFEEEALLQQARE